MSLRLVVLLLALPSAAHAWGFVGHRRLASNLEEPFAEGSCLRGWLASATGQYSFQDKACDPDRWRSTDPSEAPRHYLDIDYADPVESYPREWADVQLRFGQYAVKNGQVPWRVEEFYLRLVEDLKSGDGAQALNTVAWLSHYVGDAFSPMHDTKTQPGDLHLRYESDMLEVSAQLDAITDLARTYYGTVGKADPRNQIFDAIIVGNPVALQLIADDYAAQQDPAALYEHTRDLTARRWGDALTTMASLIGTAWVEAGRPVLSGMPTGCSTDVPQGPMVLVGFPLGEHPDAGAGVPDAGVIDEDAGALGDDAGVTAETDAGVGVQEGAPAETRAAGCGCGATSPMALAPLFAIALGLLGMARRRS